MRRLILGTAGHIDHGKTALVKELTGVDTDRLKEEKERGITVDLGFAELVTPDGTHFGVVDVPGHEGFIRNMVAGATGMDLVLLVVAADEGVMPQTREHLAILTFLGVPRILVALTKADLVEEEWLELVTDDVREMLADTPYGDAPILPVSAVTGEGIETLQNRLADLGSQAGRREEADLPRLPIDRVFTIKGAGTVVTGTLWTGTLRVDDRVQILPGELTGRVRSLQLHGQEVDQAPAGGRVAVGLTGQGIHHHALLRGQAVVGGMGWEASRMLTCKIAVLPGTGWEIEYGQRVRVHHGTAEVLARVAVLEGKRLSGGDEGWVQLRLEEPILARARDHLVLRAYSPVTTIAGGRIAEIRPPKRRRLNPGEEPRLAALLEKSPEEALEALLTGAEWRGIRLEGLPLLLGRTPDHSTKAVAWACREGKGVQLPGALVSTEVWNRGEEVALRTLQTFHSSHPLRPGIPLEELRQTFPDRAEAGLGEAILLGLEKSGRVALEKGVARLASFSPSLNPRQEKIQEELRALLGNEGLAPPGVEDLALGAGAEPGEVEQILRHMEQQGEVLVLEGDLFFLRTVVREAGIAVVEALGGTADLGPADFREVLGVTRKYLLPLLRYMDTKGVTTRLGESRNVSERIPKDWGTS